MRTITVAAVAIAPAIVLAAGGITAAAMLAPSPAAHTVTRTEVVYRTRTITRWKVRTVTDTKTVTVTDPGALQCAEEEAATITAMQDFMLANAITGPDPTQNYAKVPDNADGFTVPSQAACVPYENQLLGG